MSFIADKQTLDDLNLLGKYKSHSIYGIFNKVRTAGGERLLESMFQHPLTAPDEINLRSSTFRYFQEKQLEFPFENNSFRQAENYLGMGTAGNLITAGITVIRKKLSHSLLRDDQYNILHSGLLASISALNALQKLITRIGDQGPFRDQVKKVQAILSDHRLKWLAEEAQSIQLPLIKVCRYDFLLRHTLRHEMEMILENIYLLDVYIAVGAIAREKRFSYAAALPATDNRISVEGLRHPGLDQGVANNVSLHQDQNVLFLTGANMAGKSTLMKSYGIAIYLAHMGFPVAAVNMQFAIRDGLYTSINVPDSLSLGYSHFYAEVMRVKEVATQVSQRKNLVVIFDELFKGTNVKDAYDATLAVTAAFSQYRNSFFIISTHIIEVGETLRQQCNNLRFVFLPTVMDGTVPRYTYQLEPGITTDRHGMMIIENEGILEIIMSSKNDLIPQTCK
ncbi:MutS-related protein [Chitinophaga arvensicola]|uniref:MutS domain III n=1 Tax=Chitinophaga arvensicola TaxID=29529 RepID=A0A1I0RU04_9BACT|nr:DNA mismatch repair protein [Chitinophaga arvensicola]SEW44920.1 MutS domain III [Chitinophaga arvensicola]